MDDPTQRNRDTAEQFGNEVELVFGEVGQAFDDLFDGPREPDSAPDDRPRDDRWRHHDQQQPLGPHGCTA